MHFDPQFLTALAALLFSEFMPIISKGRFGGVLHALVMVLAKLYTAPGDTVTLAAQIESLRIEVEKLKPPVRGPQP